MANIIFHGQPAHTKGELPKIGEIAPNFKTLAGDLTEKDLRSYQGKRVVLNIFPSIDTGVCATSVRKFNEQVSNLPNTVVLCISKDLVFAQRRFCGAEGIANVELLSDFHGDFAANYAVEFLDTPLKGLLSRCVIVLDESQRVIHAQQVQNTSDEPNYEAVLRVLV